MQDIRSSISCGEGNGNPLQYSCLENPIDRGIWRATVHGVIRIRHDWVTKPPPPLIQTTSIILLSIDCNFKAENDINLHRINIINWIICTSSIQLSHSVESNSLWPHGLQHARLPCPSPTLGAYSNSCPSSQWCHPTIASSVVPFSSHLQSFPESGLFQWVSSSQQVAKNPKICTQNYINFNLTGCKVVD